MCIVAGQTKAPAIHLHLMNCSHKSLMHAVATHRVGGNELEM